MRRFRFLKNSGLALLFMFLLGTAAFSNGIDIVDVTAKHGMVSSAHEMASKAGIEIMEKGGNAVDAAVATAMALSVVEPTMSGPGGGGFMVIRLAETGEVIILDYRETAPASSTKDMYASSEAKEKHWSKYGGKSVGIPGWVMGMWTALQDYGTKTWLEVAQPAIKIAEEGYVVNAEQQRFITWLFMSMLDYNNPEDLPYFVDGLPAEVGETITLPKLAEFYRLIGQHGPSFFYGGQAGKALVEAVNAAGGDMTIDDLANYSLKKREPVRGSYRDYEIYSMPPSSSGGTHIVELLNIMENFPVSDWEYHSGKHISVLAEAMRQVFADREKYMADMDFVQIPLEGLTSKEYAKKLASTMYGEEAREEVVAGDPWPYDPNTQSNYPAGLDMGHFATSHFSVADAQGNIVASTNSLNYSSGVVVNEYSMPLNDQMDDFSSNPDSVNAPEPGKRPLSSMSPTVIIDPKGEPFMTLGSAGGWRIITTVSQIIMNTIDFGMTMDEAIEQPRIFTYSMNGKPGPLRCEVLSPKSEEFLKSRNYNLEIQGKGDYYGTAQGILFQDGNIIGGADSRRLGVPVGF